QSWPSRTLPRSFWDRLAIALRDGGMNVAFVGSGADYGGPQIPKVNSYIGRLGSIQALAHVMDGATVVIGPDSAILHIAGATNVPIVGLYTCVKGEYRAPFRKGKLAGGVEIMQPNIGCYGCLATVAAPVTSYSCKRGDNACVELFDPE